MLSLTISIISKCMFYLILFNFSKINKFQFVSFFIFRTILNRYYKLVFFTETVRFFFQVILVKSPVDIFIGFSFTFDRSTISLSRK